MDQDSRTILGSGGIFFPYVNETLVGCTPRRAVTLTEEIKPDVLKEALRKTQKRFPQFSVGIEKTKRQYLLRYIDQEMKLFQEGDPAGDYLGSDAMNGHLLRISYRGNTIYLDYFHALADGTGTISFLKSLLFHYLKLLGYPVENDGSIRTEETEYRPEEGEDGSLAFMNQDWEPFGNYVNEGCFAISDEMETLEPLGADNFVVKIIIPSRELKGVTKKYEASPVALVCPLFSKALYDKYAKGKPYDKPIVASIPVNLRTYFPTESVRCFTATASVPYPEELKDLDVESILTIQRVMMDLQMQPENLAFTTKRTYSSTCQLLTDPNTTVDQKREVCQNKIAGFTYQFFTYPVSNIGLVTLPDSMTPYVADIETWLSGAKFPYSITMCTFQDRLVMNVCQRTANLDVCRAFVNSLKSLDINAELKIMPKYHYLKYNL